VDQMIYQRLFDFKIYFQCDSDLENEIHKAKEERDERVERITNGIEHN